MRRLSRLFLLVTLAALLALGQGTLPQSSQAVPSDEPATFRIATNLIVLYASAVDKSGKLVTDLPQSSFTVFENGVEQPLKIFRREDVPVSMGILLDNSASMGGKRQAVAAAALALVKASNPDDETFIVNFNYKAYLDQQFTSNTQKLEAALDRLDSRGRTAMRDAISLAIDYAKEKGKKDKKVLVVITDGNDNISEISLKQLVRKAQQSEVLIYCIGLLNEEDPREAGRAKRAMQALAQASGGADFYPNGVVEVGKVTPEVAGEIRNQYVLAYRPTNEALDGTFRKITIHVSGKNSPTVRTRSGYYATPDAKSRSSPSSAGVSVADLAP